MCIRDRACGEELKKTLTPEQAENHPARGCLAEVCNVHSPAIESEPIHRVLFKDGYKRQAPSRIPCAAAVS